MAEGALKGNSSGGQEVRCWQPKKDGGGSPWKGSNGVPIRAAAMAQ